MLRFRVRTRARRMPSIEGLGSGPEGRLKRLRKNVTSLIRHERIESTYAQCDETRGYAEKLIQMAIRNGDKDKHTMEMADYWLLEKDLIHKLFKVLVPRYKSFPVAATQIHQISGNFPGKGIPVGVLELKGNPWPSVRPQPRDTSLHLHNVLITEAREEYQARQLNSAKRYSSSDAAAFSDEGSSVDGPIDSSVDKVAPDLELANGEGKNESSNNDRPSATNS